MLYPMSTPFADFALARRLETAEGYGNAAFIDAQARREPYSGAMRTTVAGTMLMFAGVGSPITQTFCLGMHERASDRDFEAIERFFTSRGSPVFHEVCPHAGIDVLGTLSERGYKPVELSNVLYRPIDASTRFEINPQLRVRAVAKEEVEAYAGISERGWSEMPEVLPFLRGFARSSVEVAQCFVAELDGRGIAAAAMFTHHGVALLAGASTVPEARRNGAQLALLDVRLRTAAADGCDVAMVVTAAGSASQRNAERNGFRVAYTRTKWQL